MLKKIPYLHWLHLVLLLSCLILQSYCIFSIFVNPSNRFILAFYLFSLILIMLQFFYISLQFKKSFIPPLRLIYLSFSPMIGPALLFLLIVYKTFFTQKKTTEDSPGWPEETLKLFEIEKIRLSSIEEELNHSTPLVDLFSQDQNHYAIKEAAHKLAQLATPEAIQILKNHLQDPSSDIRFFVSSALSKIREDFDNELKAAELELKKGEYKVSAKIFLAKILIRYVKSGLLNKDSHYFHLNRAKNLLQESLLSPYARSEAHLLFIKVLEELKEWEKLDHFLNQIETENLLEVSEYWQIKANLYFHLGEYPKLTHYLKKLKEIEFKNSHFLTFEAWWRHVEY